jgi:RNA polymerase sigma factor (sigma-70 family)
VEAVVIESETTSFDDRYDDCNLAAYQSAYRVLGNRSDAEDIAQEAMTRAYMKWRKIGAYAEPWLRRVATNLALDLVRQRARQRPSGPGATSDFDAADERLDLAAAVARLPRRQREVVALRYVADLPEEEVARLLGCSTGTVKQHAFRGLHALRSSGHLALEIS